MTDTHPPAPLDFSSDPGPNRTGDLRFRKRQKLPLGISATRHGNTPNDSDGHTFPERLPAGKTNARSARLEARVASLTAELAKYRNKWLAEAGL